MADLAERYGAWLHVDGAFGLFAALSPRTAHLVEGVAPRRLGDRRRPQVAQRPLRERLRVHQGLRRSSPACSRARPRTCPRWTIRSRPGGTWVPRCRGARARCRSGPRSGRTAAAATGRSSRRTSTSPSTWPPSSTRRDDLERLAEVPLNIVCFRARPPGVPEDRLDELNRRIADASIQDGRVFFGSTVYGGGSRSVPRRSAGGSVPRTSPSSRRSSRNWPRRSSPSCDPSAGSVVRRILGGTTAYGGVLASTWTFTERVKRAVIPDVT